MICLLKKIPVVKINLTSPVFNFTDRNGEFIF